MSNNVTTTNKTTTKQYKSFDIELSDIQIQHIQQYILSIHVVKFDIDHGAIIDYTWPDYNNNNIHSQQEYNTICGASLPDSSSNVNKSNYCFRFKRYNNNNNNDNQQYFFGFVYYNQRIDNSNQRGYNQQSIVIVTDLRYIDFYQYVSYIIGKQYFIYDIQQHSQSIDVIVNALYDISLWPILQAGTTHHMKLLHKPLKLTLSKKQSINDLTSIDKASLSHSASEPVNIELTNTVNNNSNNINILADDVASTTTSSTTISGTPPRPITSQTRLIPTNTRLFRHNNIQNIKTGRFVFSSGNTPDSAPLLKNKSLSNFTTNNASAPTSPNNALLVPADNISPRNNSLQQYYLNVVDDNKQYNSDNNSNANSKRTSYNVSAATTPRHINQHVNSKTKNNSMAIPPSPRSNVNKSINNTTATTTRTIYSSASLYNSYKSILPNLWLLYELILYNEPVLIIGKTPEQCSNAILSAVNIIQPLQYTSDYRPYFTLYDHECQYYTALFNRSNITNKLPNIILATTNQIFLRTFERMPHIFILDDTEKTDDEISSYVLCKSTESLQQHNISATTYTSLQPTFLPDRISIRRLLHSKQSTNNGHNTPTKQQQHKVRSNSLTPSMSESQLPIYNLNIPSLPVNNSHRSSYQQSDNKFMRRRSSDQGRQQQHITHQHQHQHQQKITKPQNTANDQQAIHHINDTVLKQHFKATTNKILSVFHPYTTLSLSQISLLQSNNFNPYYHTIAVPLFDESQFIQSILQLPNEFILQLPLQSSTITTSKKQLLQLFYKKFIQSNNFVAWFKQQRNIVEQQLQQLIQVAIIRLYNEVSDSIFLQFLDNVKVEQTLTMYDNAKNMLITAKATEYSNNHQQLIINAIEHHISLVEQCIPQTVISHLTIDTNKA